MRSLRRQNLPTRPEESDLTGAFAPGPGSREPDLESDLRSDLVLASLPDNSHKITSHHDPSGWAL